MKRGAGGSTFERPRHLLDVFRFTPDADAENREQEGGIFAPAAGGGFGKVVELGQREIRGSLEGVARPYESVDGGCPSTSTPSCMTFSIALTAGASAA